MEGWTRVDGGRSKCAARWEHIAGWRLEHCGHPTANWPWALYAPDGTMHLTGGRQGDPAKGLAWRTLEEAAGYVRTQLVANEPTAGSNEAAQKDNDMETQSTALAPVLHRAENALIVDRDELLSVVKAAARVADPKSTMPILRELLLAVQVSDKGRYLRLAATDLNSSMIGLVSLTADSPAPEESMILPATVPVKALVKLLPTLPRGPVALDGIGTGVRIYAVHGSVTTLHGRPSRDFPRLPDKAPALAPVPAEGLREALEIVTVYASTDETRCHLNVVCFDTEGPEGTQRLVATDGHRMAKYDAPLPLPKLGVQRLVPRRCALDVISLIGPRGGGICHIGFGDGHVCLQYGALLYYGKLTDAQFPPYEQVIPRDFDHTVEMDRAFLLGCVRQTAIVAPDKTYGLELLLNRGVCRVYTDNPDVGQSVVDAPARWTSGPFAYGMNAAYLGAACKGLDTHTVTFALNGELDPMVVRGPRGVFVIMPMRTDGPSYQSDPSRFPAAREALPDFTAAAPKMLTGKAAPAPQVAAAPLSSAAKAASAVAVAGHKCLEGCKRSPAGLGYLNGKGEKRPLCLHHAKGQDLEPLPAAPPAATSTEQTTEAPALPPKTETTGGATMAPTRRQPMDHDQELEHEEAARVLTLSAAVLKAALGAVLPFLHDNPVIEKDNPLATSDPSRIGQPNALHAVLLVSNGVEGRLYGSDGRRMAMRYFDLPGPNVSFLLAQPVAQEIAAHLKGEGDVQLFVKPKHVRLQQPGWGRRYDLMDAPPPKYGALLDAPRGASIQVDREALMLALAPLWTLATAGDEVLPVVIGYRPGAGLRLTVAQGRTTKQADLAAQVVVNTEGWLGVDAQYLWEAVQLAQGSSFCLEWDETKERSALVSPSDGLVVLVMPRKMPRKALSQGMLPPAPPVVQAPVAEQPAPQTPVVLETRPPQAQVVQPGVVQQREEETDEEETDEEETDEEETDEEETDEQQPEGEEPNEEEDPAQQPVVTRPVTVHEQIDAAFNGIYLPSSHRVPVEQPAQQPAQRPAQRPAQQPAQQPAPVDVDLDVLADKVAARLRPELQRLLAPQPPVPVLSTLLRKAADLVQGVQAAAQPTPVPAQAPQRPSAVPPVAQRTVGEPYGPAYPDPVPGTLDTGELCCGICLERVRKTGAGKVGALKNEAHLAQHHKSHHARQVWEEQPLEIAGDGVDQHVGCGVCWKRDLRNAKHLHNHHRALHYAGPRPAGTQASGKPGAKVIPIR